MPPLILPSPSPAATPSHHPTPSMSRADCPSETQRAAQSPSPPSTPYPSLVAATGAVRCPRCHPLTLPNSVDESCGLPIRGHPVYAAPHPYHPRRLHPSTPPLIPPLTIASRRPLAPPDSIDELCGLPVGDSEGCAKSLAAIDPIPRHGTSWSLSNASFFNHFDSGIGWVRRGGDKSFSVVQGNDDNCGAPKQKAPKASNGPLANITNISGSDSTNRWAKGGYKSLTFVQRNNEKMPLNRTLQLFQMYTSLTPEQRDDRNKKAREKRKRKKEEAQVLNMSATNNVKSPFGDISNISAADIMRCQLEMNDSSILHQVSEASHLNITPRRLPFTIINNVAHYGPNDYLISFHLI
uniref:Uncharacterized protein n=1 Tax=Oryza punctata TaxID=4537 RepID=A0A0E0KMK0_ORYPU